MYSIILLIIFKTKNIKVMWLGLKKFGTNFAFMKYTVSWTGVKDYSWSNTGVAMIVDIYHNFSEPFSTNTATMRRDTFTPALFIAIHNRGVEWTLTFRF